MSWADMSSTILGEADLSDANMFESGLNGANLRDTDLSRSLGLSCGAFEGALMDETTIFPPDLDCVFKMDAEERQRRLGIDNRKQGE